MHMHAQKCYTISDHLPPSFKKNLYVDIYLFILLYIFDVSVAEFNVAQWEFHMLFKKKIYKIWNYTVAPKNMHVFRFISIISKIQ